MKQNRAFFVLLTVLAILANGRGGSTAIARTLSSETHLQSVSSDRHLLAEASTPGASTCNPATNGQGTGIVFRYQVLGKTVVLSHSSDETALADETPADASLERVLLADETLYNSDDKFKQEIDSLLAPYIGDEVHSTDLKVIQDEVSLLYSQRGYITSWSNCVELQDDGNLVIHVTEGFINDVNVERISENPPIYIPAEKTTLGREVLEYVAPILFDSNGLPQRPINLAQLENRLQALSEDPRFASHQTFSRLRVPTQSFLDRSIAILREYLQDVDQIPQSLTASQIQDFVSDLEDQKSNEALHLDTIDLGASVLEIDLKVLADEVSTTEDATLAASLASSTNVLESRRNKAFQDYFGRGFESIFNTEQMIRFALHSLELQKPNIQAAVVYIASDGDRVSIRVVAPATESIEIRDIVRFEREEVSETEFTFNDGQFERVEEDEDEATNPLASFFGSLFGGSTVGRDELVVEVESFWRAVQNPNSDGYQRHADQLYDLLIRPIENEFRARGINVNTLLVAMDADLGFLPLAALYDSETEQYLAEKYRFTVIPSFGALDIRPSNLEQTQILAMGTSEFRQADRYAPLAAVPLELRLVEEIWGKTNSTVLRNADFTLDNLRQQRREQPYSIVHLASHANFRAGQPGDSSIQFWDTTLPLNDLQLSTLNFNRPPVELLVLSACQTALGNEDAVLGFAGSFLSAEVKSVLASLWSVNDLTSLLYMIEFYRNLRQGLTKAEAVQNSQLALLDKQRTIQNLKELRLIVEALLDEEQTQEELTVAEISRLRRMLQEIDSDAEITAIAEEFTHPFYWSAYTLVGNPW
jgi:CHAT domain-containing protein